MYRGRYNNKLQFIKKLNWIHSHFTINFRAPAQESILYCTRQ